MEVDIGHIYNFPFQTRKTHTWESCTNHISGIFTLIMVFNIYMNVIFNNA